MKKLSKTISLMLAFVMVLSLPNLLLVNVQALEIGSEESLGAVNACNGHILGTFSGVPACVNESGDLHIARTIFRMRILETVSTSNAAETGILQKQKRMRLRYWT